LDKRQEKLSTVAWKELMKQRAEEQVIRGG
jgi:hypothetical protein